MATPSPVSVQGIKFEVNAEINEIKSNDSLTKIEKTDESIDVDIEQLDDDVTDVQKIVTPAIEIPKLDNDKHEINHQIEVELRSSPIKKDDGLSTSVPNQRTLWPHEHTPPISRGSLSDMLASNLRRDHRELRHSMSNSSTMRQKEETMAMIRGSSSCSKDTLLFIDQQNHGLMDDDYMSNRSLWVSKFVFKISILFDREIFLDNLFLGQIRRRRSTFRLSKQQRSPSLLVCST